MRSTRQNGFFPHLATPELAHHRDADLPAVGAGVAPPTGLSPPTKDNAAELGSEGGAEGQKQADSDDCADHHLPQQLVDLDADRKHYLTLQARAALRGIALNATDNDAGAVLYVASMHALCKAFDDVAEVEVWLDRIGAPK